MNDWLVNCKKGTSEEDVLLARLFWQFEFDAKQKIVFAYTSKELAERYGISEPRLRNIQVAVCTVQAPDSTCRQCGVGLLWRSKSFGSRGDFQKYVDDWKASICNECRTANAAEQKAEREAQERAWKADAAARKTRMRARYGDSAIGDCPRCEGILIVRKSQHRRDVRGLRTLSRLHVHATDTERGQGDGRGNCRSKEVARRCAKVRKVRCRDAQNRR